MAKSVIWLFVFQILIIIFFWMEIAFRITDLWRTILNYPKKTYGSRGEELLLIKRMFRLISLA